MLTSAAVPGRLLLVSYFFPPEPHAGSLRVGALSKYLPEHGWTVDLVTRVEPDPAPNGRVVVVPHKAWIERLRGDLGIRPDKWFRAPPPETWTPGSVEPPRHLSGRMYGVFRRTILQAATWPDRTIGWAGRVRRPLRAMLEEDAPDAILSTSPPETTHFLARWAHRRTGAPWIADLRDPWSETELMAHAAWRRALDRRTERRILAHTRGLVTVSEPIAESLRALHPGREVHAILNGFDPEKFPGPAEPDRSAFTLTYAGGLTLGKHDVFTFLDGARRFLDDCAAAGVDPGLRIRFVGAASPELRGHIARAGLEKVTTCSTRVPHADAVAAMRTSPVNVFFPWQDPERPGVYSGKLFEYLGARRPILAVGAFKGVAGTLVEQSGLGRVAADAAETASLLRVLWNAHRAGADPWSPDETVVTRHSHRAMVARFAELLDAATAERGRPRPA